MEFVYVVGGGFIMIIIYIAFLRDRGGVRNIGTAPSRELMRHITIVKGGVTYRPETAEETREVGLYKVTMHEIQPGGIRREAMPYMLNMADYRVRVGLALVPGELVMEEKYDSILELLDPVQKKLRDDAMLEFLQGLEYKELEKKAQDAEAGKKDLKKTVVDVRKSLLDYVKLLKVEHEKVLRLETSKKALTAQLDAYQGAPETINRMVAAERAVTRLTRELNDVRADKTAEAEAVKSVLGRQPADYGGGGDVVIKP